MKILHEREGASVAARRIEGYTVWAFKCLPNLRERLNHHQPTSTRFRAADDSEANMMYVRISAELACPSGCRAEGGTPTSLHSSPGKKSCTYM